MKGYSMKKSNIIIIAVIAVALLGSIFYWSFNNNAPSSTTATINDAGVSFTYPASLTYQKHGPTVSTSHYNTYRINGSGESSIIVLIPIAEAPGETAPFSERLKDYPEGYEGPLPQIDQISVNGHDAERMVSGTDAEPSYTMTSIQLSSNYPDTRIVLGYQHFPDDSSLDKAWSMILETLEF